MMMVEPEKKEKAIKTVTLQTDIKASLGRQVALAKGCASGN